MAHTVEHQQTAQANVLDPTHVGRHYFVYTIGSTDSVKNSAYTAMQNAMRDVMQILGQKADAFFHTQTVGAFTYVFFDRKKAIYVISKYITSVVDKKIAQGGNTQGWKDLRASMLQHVAQLRQPEIRVNISPYYISGAPDDTQGNSDISDSSVHIWEFNSERDALDSLNVLAHSTLQFPARDFGTATQDRPLADGNEIQALGRDLSIFFQEVSNRRIELPPMPPAPNIPATQHLFSYMLSGRTSPTASAYFSSVTQLRYATVELRNAASSLASSFNSLPVDSAVYVVAEPATETTHYAYFSDESSARAYVGMRSILLDPEFHKRLDELFRNSESYENFGGTDSASSFVIEFLTDHTQHNSIMTAFSFERSRSGNALRNPDKVLPPIYGLLLEKQGTDVTCTVFDAKPIVIETITNIRHFDAHGVQLIQNLTAQGHWANLVDFAFSFLGESKALALTKSTEHDLGQTPTQHVVRFNGVLAQMYTQYDAS